MSRTTILDWPTSVIGWIVYLIVGIGSLGAVGYFARAAMPVWGYCFRLVWRGSQRQNSKFAPVKPTVNLAIVLAGLMSSAMCLVFASLFLHLIVFEGVQAVSVDHSGVRLEYRIPWRDQFIKREDIRSVGLTERGTGKYGRRLPPSRRYHILTITTDRATYVIDPHEWGHDSKVLGIYGELRDLDKLSQRH